MRGDKKYFQKLTVNSGQKQFKFKI